MPISKISILPYLFLSLGAALSSSIVGLDGCLEGLGVRADDLGDLVAVLKEQECGHGADAKFLGDVGDFVNIKFVETGFGVVIGELYDLWRNYFAGTAPGCEAVEDDELVLELEGLVPFGLAGQVVYAFLAHFGGIGEEAG